MAEDGFEVFILAPEDEWSQKLRNEGFYFIAVEIDNKGTSPLRDLRLIRDFLKVYKRYRPDAIFHYTIKPNIYGSIAAKIRGIPSIAFVTGAGTAFSEKAFWTVVAKFLLRFALYCSKQVWFLNDDDKNLFTSSNLVLPTKCRLIPGEGINLEKFNNAGKRQQRNDVSFLFLGRLLWDKGIWEYIRAARNMKNENKAVTFKILGFLDCQNPSAIPRLKLEEWINEGLVEYLGVTDNVRDVIVESDCVVLPAVHREGIPRSLLEASSLGIPVIATDVPGCRDVVDDKVTGYLCLPRNYADLQNKMELIVNAGDAKRKMMGIAGRDRVAKLFDVRIIIGKYKQALNELFSPQS